MKKIRKVLSIPILILLFILTISKGFAGEQNQATEREKILEIVQGMQVNRAYHMRLRKAKVPTDENFCKSFLDDLKTRRSVEFIEPIVQTDDYNDPKLQSYIGKCPKLQLNKTVGFQPRIWEYAKTLPEEEREKLGTVWYTNLDFRLYQVDMGNKKEYVFYGGGRFSPKENSVGWSADFIVVDFEKCENKGMGQVSDTINYLTKKPTGNHNLILMYKGKSYILEMSYYPNENKYYASLFEWRMAKAIKKLSASLICSFEQTPEKGGSPK